MKKKLFILVSIMMLFGITASAKNVGDVIDKVIPTTIQTNICGYDIPSYNIGGETAVLVSNLTNCGFDVEFENGVAIVDYNWKKKKKSVFDITKSDINVLYTDIKVLLNGIEVPSFNIDGSMAIPIERTCDTYLETNKENKISEYSLNYIWRSTEKSLSLDISDDRVSYQDFMIDLIKAANMDFDSLFYNDFVKDESIENPNGPYLEKITDIRGTKLEKYIHLLEIADLVDTNTYEDEFKLYPYRGMTYVDAALLLTRILGDPIEAEIAYNKKYWAGKLSKSGLKRSKDITIYTTKTVTTINQFGYIKDAYDWYKVPEWIQPYFVYMLETGIITPDDNGYINPNYFLTKEAAKGLISKTIACMEKDSEDVEIKLKFESNSVYNNEKNKLYSTTAPVKKINDILYVPATSLFNEKYDSIFSNKDNRSRCKKEDHAYVNYYSMNANTRTFNIFGNCDLYETLEYSNTFSEYKSFYANSEKPIVMLYGEPMLPIYDYN